MGLNVIDFRTSIKNSVEEKEIYIVMFLQNFKLDQTVFFPQLQIVIYFK